MPKPRKYELVRCSHFAWRLTKRGGKWYADGRSNTPSAGRHSLGTKSKVEALQLLPQLDQVRAEDLGLAPRSTGSADVQRPLALEEGRKLYEKHIARSRVTGGVRPSTRKRYRTVFDKFIAFARPRHITTWNRVTASVLTDYANDLESRGYANKSLENELTTLKQAIKWLITAGHLKGMEPITLPLRKAESQPAYCYRSEEVQAIVEHLRGDKSLKWLANAVIALACTGLRIAELASLRWADVNLQTRRLTLTDETGRSAASDRQRRQLKSGRSRSFPIHPDFMAVLQAISPKDGYIFRGPRGGLLKPDTVRRILVREVIEPLSAKFPTPEGERGFQDGRLHSFRHYFCSTCANNNVPERIVMDWLGHADSEMIRHYYHLHDDEARRRMDQLNFLNGAGGRSAGDPEDQLNKEDVEPKSIENSGNG